MLEFRESREPNSLDIRRDAYRIGYLHHTAGFEPRIIIEDTDRLSLEELRQLVANCEELMGASKG